MRNKVFWIAFLILTSLILGSCNLSKPGPSSASSATPRRSQRLEPILRLDSGGHSGAIRDLAATSDRKYLISAGDDKTIRVWDARIYRETRRILGWQGKGRAGKIFALALSPDDRLLAVGGFLAEGNGINDGLVGAIRVYDFPSGKMIGSFKAHDDSVLDLAFSSDGRYLVSGSSDSAVKVWAARKTRGERNALELIHTFKKHRSAVRAVRIFSYQKDWRIVSVGVDGRVFLHSLNRRTVLASHSQRSAFGSLAVSPLYIAVGVDNDRKIYIFDLDLKLIKSLRSGSKPAALAFSPNGELLLSGSGSYPYKRVVYSAGDNFKKIRSFGRRAGSALAAAFLDDQTAVTGGGDKSVYLWNPIDGKIKARLSGKGRTILRAGIRGKNLVWGNYLARRSPNYRGEWQKRFDLETFGLPAPLNFSGVKRMPREYRRYSLAHAKGGKYGFENAVLQIRKSGRKIVSIIRGTTNGLKHNAYGFGPKGVIFSGGSHGVLSAYNLQGQKLADFIGHTGDVRAIGADGDWLISGGSDQVVKLWDLKSLKKDRTKIYPALNIFATEDDQWAAWTEEGFFAASPGGRKRVGYHINQGRNKEAKYITFERIYHAFQRPDLAKAKMEGEDISQFSQWIDIRKILDRGGLPPEVKITTSSGFSKKRDIYLEAEVCDQGGGIGDFIFWLNGRSRRIGQSHFSVSRLKDNDPNCLDKYKVRKRSPVSLINERAVISLGAYNRANTLRGAKDEIRLDFPNPARQRSNLHIVAVAVDSREDGNFGLSRAKADADSLIETLKEKAEPLFQEIKIHQVYDLLATKKGIENRLKQAALKTRAEDVFVLFMAGRGEVCDRTGEYYFLPANFKSFDDGKPLRQGISTDELSRWIGMIAAEKVFILLDSRRDGKAAGGLEKKSAARRTVRDGRAIQKLAEAAGRSVLVVHGDLDKPTQGRGHFVRLILRALRGKKLKMKYRGETIKPDKNNDGYITVKELADFVKEALTKNAVETRSYPRPLHVSTHKDDDYPISVPRISEFGDP